MIKRPLGDTGLSIAPLVLGGNVFGWTLDEAASFAVLDAFVAHGFDAIDTADVYSYWARGNRGGESEAIIGGWLKARPGMRDKVVIFTKVGWDAGDPDRTGLSRRWIAEAVEASLARLGIDAIDLYFSHRPDPRTPHEETLGAFDDLIRAGKVKAVGASNFDAAQLGEALAVSRATGLPPYRMVQPVYNLADRGAFDGALRDLCAREGLGVVTHSSLASGFLTGKYRSTEGLAQSPRGQSAARYLDARGLAILAALDAVASAHDAGPAQVALAWLMAREGVTAPIASATRPSQVESFAKAAALTLFPREIALLDNAGG